MIPSAVLINNFHGMIHLSVNTRKKIGRRWGGFAFFWRRSGSSISEGFTVYVAIFAIRLFCAFLKVPLMIKFSATLLATLIAASVNAATVDLRIAGNYLFT